MGRYRPAYAWRRDTDGKLGASLLALLMVAPAFSIAFPVGGSDVHATATPEADTACFNTTQYHGYDETTALLGKLSADHPSVCTLFSIGKTFEGREIWCMKVSDSPIINEKEEAEVLYIGAHHAREWPSVETVLWTLVFILEHYGKTPSSSAGENTSVNWSAAQITWLVDNRQLYFIPMLNPDGLEYARDQYYDQGWTDTNTLWRKNREPNSNPLTGRPYPEQINGQSTRGVDLNRNYGWHWGEVGYQGYADPTREDYMGPVDTRDDDGDGLVAEDNMDGVDSDRDGRIDCDPRGGFSATETKALRRFLETHRIRILMSYHTFTATGEIYWAYMYTRQLPPDEELFTHIAEQLAAYNGYDYRNYTGTSDNTRNGPLVDGDLNDYAYGALGILSYCIELKMDAFIVPPGQLPAIEDVNLGPNLLVAELAANPWGRRFTIEHTPLADTTDIKGPYVVKARITSETDLQLRPEGVRLHYSDDGFLTESTVTMNERGGYFFGDIPGSKKNLRFDYYIEAVDTTDNVTLAPGYAPLNSFSFRVLASERVTPALLWAHIVVIVAGLGAMIMTAISSLAYLARRKEKSYLRTVKLAGISTGLVFLGGFPLGWAVAYQRYGAPWTGIPFGWDITDNKTLLILLMWMGAVLLVRGTTARMLATGPARFCPFKLCLKAGARASGGFKGWLERERRNTVGPGTFAVVGMLVTAVSLALYLVPHSI